MDHLLQDSIEELQINDDTFRITLPFLDQDNDHIEIYVINQHNGAFLITDDGAAFGDLSFRCLDPSDNGGCQQAFASIAASHGVSVSESDNLQIVSDLDNLSESIPRLARCMSELLGHK